MSMQYVLVAKGEQDLSSERNNRIYITLGTNFTGWLDFQALVAVVTSEA